jgi:hypothetical protein
MLGDEFTAWLDKEFPDALSKSMPEIFAAFWPICANGDDYLREYERLFLLRKILRSIAHRSVALDRIPGFGVAILDEWPDFRVRLAVKPGMRELQLDSKDMDLPEALTSFDFRKLRLCTECKCIFWRTRKDKTKCSNKCGNRRRQQKRRQEAKKADEKFRKKLEQEGRVPVSRRK